MPPIESTLEGSNPQGEEEFFGKKLIVVRDVDGLTRSFKGMSKTLINRLIRDEANDPVPDEGSQHTTARSVSIHREIKEVEFPSSWVPQTPQSSGQGWRIGDMHCSS
jgi:hypothetical protein